MATAICLLECTQAEAFEASKLMFHVHHSTCITSYKIMMKNDHFQRGKWLGPQQDMLSG